MVTLFLVSLYCHLQWELLEFDEVDRLLIPLLWYRGNLASLVYAVAEKAADMIKMDSTG